MHYSVLTLLDLGFFDLPRPGGAESAPPPANCSAWSDFNEICTVQVLGYILHIDKILSESIQYCPRFWTKHVQSGHVLKKNTIIRIFRTK